MSMIPVFMCNDIGGIVYVCKNELCLLFSDRAQLPLRIETDKLLGFIEKNEEDDWDTNKFCIERYKCPHDGEIFVSILIRNIKQDWDKAVIFQCDLIEVLTQVECFA